MVSDIFEMNGWDSYFLGSNTSTQELVDFTRTIKQDLLAISLSIYMHLPTLETMLQVFNQKFANIQILVGGQEILLKYKNVIYKPDINSIEAEYLPELFESFSQEEMGYFRKYEGNGIGLALVKTYCELNNAEIEVESEKSIGSTFRVIFD